MYKIALIHDWFTTLAGSEKIIEQLLQIYPDADLYSLIDVMAADDRQFIGNRSVKTSFLQNFPGIRKWYRSYLPLMPLAIEQFNLSQYDLIISNCHAVSKGVLTSPEQLHISYIQSPMRYAWDLQDTYLGIGGVKNKIARLFLHYIRLWDFTAAQRPDQLIGNSGFIAKRINKYYRRSSAVIYPPVDTEYYTPGGEREKFYLTASRFVPYKRIDLVMEAFRDMPDKKLVVIGDGPDADKIRRLAAPNISILGYQTCNVLREYMQSCRAFVFASKEDFGIIPVEAQACGAPVIAFGEGGTVETVNDIDSQQPTGIFFHSQTPEAILDAVRLFERNQSVFQPDISRRNAERFSNHCFRTIFKEFISSASNEFFSQ